MDIAIGDYVFHSHCGVCLVKSVSPLSGDDSGELYYVLTPAYGEDKQTIIRVPVSRGATLTTPMNKAEAERYIASWPSHSLPIYITDSKARKLAYESSLRSGDIRALIPLLEGASQRKEKDGHLNSMDSQFVSKATPIVYGSLAYGLGLDYEEVFDLIRNR